MCCFFLADIVLIFRLTWCHSRSIKYSMHDAVILFTLFSWEWVFHKATIHLMLWDDEWPQNGDSFLMIFSSVSSVGSLQFIRWSTVSRQPYFTPPPLTTTFPSPFPKGHPPLSQSPETPPCLTCQTPSANLNWPSFYPMVAPRPTLSLLLAVLACTGPARPSPPLLLRPRERERDTGGVNIAVVHSGSSLLPETAVVGGAGVGEPGLGNGPGGGGRGVTDTASLAGVAAMASLSSLSSSYLSLAALVGETVMTPSGQANVIYLAVNESSPGTLLLQLCELLATTPLQVENYTNHISLWLPLHLHFVLFSYKSLVLKIKVQLCWLNIRWRYCSDEWGWTSISCNTTSSHQRYTWLCLKPAADTNCCYMLPPCGQCLYSSIEWL